MAESVYVLGVLSCLLCAILLWRQFGISRNKLLLWSALCFLGLSLNSILVFVDLILIPDIDLHVLRWSITAFSLGLLVVGLVWESK